MVLLNWSPIGQFDLGFAKLQSKCGFQRAFRVANRVFPISAREMLLSFANVSSVVGSALVQPVSSLFTTPFFAENYHVGLGISFFVVRHYRSRCWI
jgi:hypothetical protein